METDIMQPIRYSRYMIRQWVSQALEHSNLSQAELARQLNQRFNWTDDRSVINKIIKGRRDVSGSEMMEISEVTGYPLPHDENAGKSIVSIMGLIGAGGEIDPDFEQIPHDGLEQIELPFPLPDEMIAFEVRGISMLPVYKDGHVVVVYREQKRPLEVFFGEEAAVRTSDGRRYIKTVERGASGVNLRSFNADLMENVHLDWIGEIFAILPRTQIKKMARNGGIQGRLRLASGG